MQRAVNAPHEPLEAHGDAFRQLERRAGRDAVMLLVLAVPLHLARRDRYVAVRQ
jgi:hypothetical protein